MSEQTPTISIIMPIYKVAQYLRRCLGSIKEQTYTDFEVLMIDDGSPDESGSICIEYQQNDPRFHYYRKENGGQLQHVITDYQQHGENTFHLLTVTIFWEKII